MLIKAKYFYGVIERTHFMKQNLTKNILFCGKNLKADLNQIFCISRIFMKHMEKELDLSLVSIYLTSDNIHNKKLEF